MKRPFQSSRRGSHAPLTNPQKAYLSQLAQEAHAKLEGHGAIDEQLTPWRRAEAIRACGRRISEAVNGDFETLEAHFAALAGRSGKALDAALRGDSNEERQARWKLAKLCQERGLEVPALEGASVKKIWAVYFNIQASKRKATKAAKATLGQAVDLHAELAQAVKEERYEDAARLKRAIEAAALQPTTDAAGDDDIPF